MKIYQNKFGATVLTTDSKTGAKKYVSVQTPKDLKIDSKEGLEGELIFIPKDAKRGEKYKAFLGNYTKRDGSINVKLVIYK